MIKGFNLRIVGNARPMDIAQRLRDIVGMGANAVSIVVSHYVYLETGTPNLAISERDWGGPQRFIYPDIGQDPSHPYGNTPSIDVVEYAVREAQLLGLKVWLKPHIDSYYGAWRGWIEVLPAQRIDWEWAYKNRFLRRYVDLANAVHCELVLGTELLGVTRRYGGRWWAEIAEWARGTAGAFKPNLTYAANWGAPGDGEVFLLDDLWRNPDVRFIGVDGYWPISFAADWSPIRDNLAALSARVGKPVLFTEIGYPNALEARQEPYGISDCAAAHPDPATPGELYGYFLSEIATQPWCAGYLVWEAERVTATANYFSDPCETKGITHALSPYNKLGARLMKWESGA